MNTLTLDQIEEALRTAYRGAQTPILSAAEAKLRAAMVFEDMAKVRLPLELHYWQAAFPGYEPLGIPAYKLPGSPYGPEVPVEAEDVFKADGPGLSCGDLLKLSKACKIGRDILGVRRWPQLLTTRLRDPKEHLDAVEEMIWLGFWRPPFKVDQSYKLNPANDSNIDWRLTFKMGSVQQVINLEVKFRRRDWIGRVDGSTFSRDFDSYFQDLEGKFCGPAEGELNLVGISTFTPSDHSLRRCIERYLKEHREVSGVIVWSYHSGNDLAALEVHSEHAELIRMFLTGIDEEERNRVTVIRFLWRDRDKSRALRSGNLPSFLAALRELGAHLS
jgi:hypothetical protein